jgi:predicted nucleic acid-binding protein
MIVPKDASEHMAAYLVDTNYLSVLVTKQHPLRHHILRRIWLGDEFSIAAPALTELLYGIQTIPQAGPNRREWTSLSVLFGFYGIDQQDAERAAALQVEVRRGGWQRNTVDALLAAITLRYNCILLTTDKDFGTIPGQPLEN